MNTETILIIAVIILAIMFIASLAIKGKKNNYNRKEEEEKEEDIKELMPYLLKGSVLTNSEINLYNILYEFCCKNNLRLLSKIRIADFVQTKKQENYYKWFNRISAKHVDFLICQPEGFKPLLAIELDDYTHKQKNRQERDNFINSVYQNVGLPILHITDINSEKIVADVSGILGLNVSTIL